MGKRPNVTKKVSKNGRPQKHTARLPVKLSVPTARKYLSEHGVSVEFAQRCGVKIQPGRIIFPKYDPMTGELLDSGRIRPMDPKPDPKTSRMMKFIQRRGTESRLYFPKFWDWKSAFLDTSIPLFLVESECSALALAERGYHAIGTGGKDNIFLSGSKRTALHPDLDGIRLRGRKVYLMFDADDKVNPQVRASIEAAASLLSEAA
jgi:Domain of unknown function (DUF3854)